MRNQFKLIEYTPMEITSDLSKEEVEQLLQQHKKEFPKNLYKIEEQEISREQYLHRYPRICAHIICHSLGYATPTVAAAILKDAKEGKENWCEWIYSCYDKNPLPAVQFAIKSRHRHTGYMSEYAYAIALVKRAIDSGKEPLFASWF